MNLFKWSLVILCSLAVSQLRAQELHIYNWDDYIDSSSLQQFEQETGIKVVYHAYFSNEEMAANLANGTYDLVFPSARPFAQQGISASLYQPLNRKLLSNYGNLNASIMNTLDDIDPNNQYLIPFMWGTSGFAYNQQKVEAILGKGVQLNSWAMIFDPAISSKLAECGIAMSDEAVENVAAIWAYKGAPGYAQSTLNLAINTMRSVRTNIRYYDNDKASKDLAAGKLCVAQGYSGDMLMAQKNAKKSGITLKYVIPAEGAVIWTDVIAIPAQAKNVAAAHQFIDFILRPEVAARISNYVMSANANSQATDLLANGIRDNNAIYPQEQQKHLLLSIKGLNEQQINNINRTWNRAK